MNCTVDLLPKRSWLSKFVNVNAFSAAGPVQSEYQQVPFLNLQPTNGERLSAALSSIFACFWTGRTVYTFPDFECSL